MTVNLIRLLFAGSVLGLLTGCPMGATSTQQVRDGGGPDMAQAQAADYDGPQARIAVAQFENRAGGQDWWSPQIGDGMADMLTTSLFNTGRFIVLERQAIDDVLSEQDLIASGRVREGATTEIDQLEDAELLVVAAVTEFQEDSGGTRAGGGGTFGRIAGALTGGTQSAHMAIDLRVIDTQTGRVIAATSVEGEARDFDIGGAIGGYTGGTSLGGSLSTWENTPREKALRQVIGEAVEFVVQRTPDQYYRHGGSSQAGSSGNGQAASASEQVVITASSLNVRSGPGSGNPVQFSLGGGSIVDVLDRSGDWVEIRDDNGRSGWVAGQYTRGLQ